MLLLITLILTLLYIFYKYITFNNDFWKNLNVPYDKPTFFFGSLKESVFLKRHFGETVTDIYRKHTTSPYVGFFKFRNPELIIRDPELIKDVVIRDFSHFQANDFQISDKEIYLKKHPFVMSGDEWKTTRTQLLQCFTSAKLKTLVPTMETVSNRFVEYIEELTKEQGAVEAKDIATRFTVENVVNSAFGLEADCFKPGKSNFMVMSEKIFYPSFMTSMRMLSIILFPSLTKFLDVRFLPKDVGEFFVDLINKLVKYRKENNIQRKDFLDILIETEKRLQKDGYGMIDIISHSVGLFMDGTETTSIPLAFLLYEVANNLDIQKKLRDEVDTVLKKYDGKVTYEGIQEMTYLDCIFNETMRMHPPGLALSKICTKDYNLRSPNDPKKTILLKAGINVTLPVHALHYDEQYYPDPERFDPERFSDENKQKIVKGTYLPFGEGQRICLGQRFATLQVKVAVAVLISKCEVRVNERTIQPLQIDPRYFMLLAKGGLWLDIHKRQDK